MCRSVYWTAVCQEHDLYFKGPVPRKMEALTKAKDA